MTAFIIASLCTAAALEDGPKVRAWVDQEIVGVNSPFWIHLEGTGGDVIVPETMECYGVVIDPIDVRYSVFTLTSNDNEKKTVRRSFNARVLEPGNITIPSQQILVDGASLRTDAVSVTALTRPQSLDPVHTGAPGEFDREEIVFIDMSVDRREVYQGEPIYFRTQLWRIISPRVDSGPYGESRIILPKTEGFFIENLEPLSRTATREDRDYDIWEERMILYPTVVGDVEIGKWHWEGVALVDTPGRRRRDRIYFQLNVGPIPVTVHALPESPEGFSGTVGQFSMDIATESTEWLQGVPVKLTLNVTGRGNPFAMGDPTMPSWNWAQVAGPSREVLVQDVDDEGRQHMEKQFTYTVTPTRIGAYTLDEISFTFFDPDSKDFETISAPSKDVSVIASVDRGRTLVTSENTPLPEEEVAILEEDLHPTIETLTSFAVKKTGNGRTALVWLTLVAAAPILGYAYVGQIAAGRRRRPTQDLSVIYTLPDALRLIRSAPTADEPHNELATTICRYLAGLGLSPTSRSEGKSNTVSMTSAEASDLLENMQLTGEVRASIVSVLQDCERERFGRLEDASVYGIGTLCERAVKGLEALQNELEKVQS